MITEDKVTEIFCIADDFCKVFDAQMAKYTFNACSLTLLVDYFKPLCGTDGVDTITHADPYHRCGHIHIYDFRNRNIRFSKSL